MKNITLREACHILGKKFEAAGSDAPQLCARAIVMHVLKLDTVQLIVNYQENLSPNQWDEICALALRHEACEPLAYLLGYKEFYGRDFLVNTHTLIPRQETEDVLDSALIALDTWGIKQPVFADIGTGSGCIGLSLAAERKMARGVLLDISSKALEMTYKNAKRLDLLGQVQIIRADLQCLPLAQNGFDLIISNPPYVSEQEYATLLPNVRNFEPKSALVPDILSSEADELGLYHIKCIARQAAKLLKPNGLCIVEHGSSQGKSVRKVFESSGNWQEIKTGQDLADRDRYCLCRAC